MDSTKTSAERSGPTAVQTVPSVWCSQPFSQSSGFCRWSRAEHLAFWALGLALALLASAFFMPRVLGPFKAAWTRFGLVLHPMVSPIILAPLFPFVVTPTAILIRLAGKDLQSLRWDEDRAYYRVIWGLPVHRPRPCRTNSEGSMDFVKELWAFLRTRKKYWLIPILIMMTLFGGLLVLAKGSAVAPFIYTLF